MSARRMIRMNMIKVIHEEDMEFPSEDMDGELSFEIPLSVLEDLFRRYHDCDVILPLGMNIGHHFSPYYRKDYNQAQRRFDVTDEIEGDMVKMKMQLIGRN
jgi:hypothetical protein